MSHDITKVDQRLSPKHFNADDSASALFDLTGEVYFSVFHQEDIEFKASLYLLDLAWQLKQDFELRHGVAVLLLYPGVSQAIAPLVNFVGLVANCNTARPTHSDVTDSNSLIHVEVWDDFRDADRLLACKAGDLGVRV